MTTTISQSRLTLAGALRAELLKITTMRGMWWIALSAVGLAVLIVATSGYTPPEAGMEAEWTVDASAEGLMMPWVILAVYSALLATGEWSSGMYRVSFSAVPRRDLWLAAKAMGAAIYTGVVSVIVLATSLIVVLVQHSDDGAVIDWTVGHTWQIFVGAPAVCIATSIMAVGIGAFVRSSGIAVTAVIGLLLVLPFASLFGLDWLGHVTAYLPSGAGDAVVGSGSFGIAPDDFGALVGSIVMLAWAVVACVAASVAMRKRDA